MLSYLGISHARGLVLEGLATAQTRNALFMRRTTSPGLFMQSPPDRLVGEKVFVRARTGPYFVFHGAAP